MKMWISWLTVVFPSQPGGNALHALGDWPASASKMLIDAGIDIYTTKRDGRTVMHWAAACNNRPFVDLLLKSGLGVDVADLNGWQPVHEAAWLGNLGMLEFLLARGASVSAHDLAERTPLHWAASGGSVDAVKLLVDRGAFSSLDLHGNTPLMLAEAAGEQEICDFLSRNGRHGATS